NVIVVFVDSTYDFFAVTAGTASSNSYRHERWPFRTEKVGLACVQAHPNISFSVPAQIHHTVFCNALRILWIVPIPNENAMLPVEFQQPSPKTCQPESFIVIFNCCCESSG